MPMIDHHMYRGLGASAARRVRTSLCSELELVQIDGKFQSLLVCVRVLLSAIYSSDLHPGARCATTLAAAPSMYV